MDLFGNLSKENRAIVEKEMANHDKHYRCLVSWIKREMKRQGKRYRYGSGPATLSYMFSQGATVSQCLWEKYGGIEQPTIEYAHPGQGDEA